MNGSSDDDTSRYLRTELLERIAHELRGPAGVTLGALDELEHALGPEVVEQNRVLLAMARRGVRRVLRTAERLSRTSLLEGGQLGLSCMPTDLRVVVRHAVRDAELTEGRTSVKVAVQLPEEPCVLELDSGWWSIALSELVAQSIRSARREVEVVAGVRGGSVLLTVRDDRAALIDTPDERFVSLKDRRDAALGWPLICDVARAHHMPMTTEPLRDAAGTLSGQRVIVEMALPAPHVHELAGE